MKKFKDAPVEDDSNDSLINGGVGTLTVGANQFSIGDAFRGDFGGVITLHGKESTDLELTTDDKTAFQETMDEFVNEVSDLVDFEPLNVYKTDVEWGGKIIDFDIQYYFTLGENNGIYIDGTMIKVDENFLNMLNKLDTYYEKFKAKWAKVLASRKKTSPKPTQQP